MEFLIYSLIILLYTFVENVDVLFWIEFSLGFYTFYSVSIHTRHKVLISINNIHIIIAVCGNTKFIVKNFLYCTSVIKII